MCVLCCFFFTSCALCSVPFSVFRLNIMPRVNKRQLGGRREGGDKKIVSAKNKKKTFSNIIYHCVLARFSFNGFSQCLLTTVVLSLKNRQTLQDYKIITEISEILLFFTRIFLFCIVYPCAFHVITAAMSVFFQILLIVYFKFETFLQI